MEIGGHVERMGMMIIVYTFWLQSLKERAHSEDLEVDIRIILRWFSRK
jgi:hypothetical protein